ncbi:hypothetical protein BZA70DRAFT_272154 [Myxozyma melibiosi]|uniref:Cryptic loci regulator 2 N-terminal domain-containing protein n=1 Tax=Myxozyma melibiosi TaxID=54550 RepID=A0ABR1FF29_9ASCO
MDQPLKRAVAGSSQSQPSQNTPLQSTSDDEGYQVIGFTPVAFKPSPSPGSNAPKPQLPSQENATEIQPSPTQPSPSQKLRPPKIRTTAESGPPPEQTAPGRPIILKYSDGDDKGHPSGELLNRQPDEAGRLYYYVKLGKQDVRFSQFLAKLSALLSKRVGEELTLKKLPNNYALFLHTTTKTANDIRERHDTYTFGHPSGKRYRSATEFSPHVYWLYANSTASDPDNVAPCECSLCQTHAARLSLDNSLLNAEREKRKRKEESEVAETDVPVRERSSKLEPFKKRRITKSLVAKLTPLEAKYHAQRLLVEGERASERAMGIVPFRPGELVWAFWEDDPYEPDKLNGSNAVLWEGKLRVPHPALVVHRPLDPTPWVPAVNTANDKNLPADAFDRYSLFLYDVQEYLEDVKSYYIAPWLLIDPRYCTDEQALKISRSWSVFGKTEPPLDMDTDADRLYEGAFLGAEKIWRGDVIFIEPDEDKGRTARDLMVVEAISVEDNKELKTSELMFSGTVYMTDPPDHTDSETIMRDMMPFRVSLQQKAYSVTELSDLITIGADLVVGRWYPPGILQGQAILDSEKIKVRMKSRRRVASSDQRLDS